MMNELTVQLRGASALRELPPVLWNKEEVEARLEELIGCYRGRAYAPEDVQYAKKDRAEVNRIEKELAEAQKRVADMYKAPVEQFVADMKRMRATCKEISGAIDVQVKQVEEAARMDKSDKLKAVYEEYIGAELKELVAFDRLLDKKWLNVSTPFNTAKGELMVRIETLKSENKTLRAMAGNDFAQIQRAWLENLNIRDGIQALSDLQATRAAQQRAEDARRLEEAAKAAAPLRQPTDEEAAAMEAGHERAKTNEVIEQGRFDFDALQRQQEEAETPLWYNFGAYLTKRQIARLKAFFAAEGITYGKARM